MGRVGIGQRAVHAPDREQLGRNTLREASPDGRDLPVALVQPSGREPTGPLITATRKNTARKDSRRWLKRDR